MKSFRRFIAEKQDFVLLFHGTNKKNVSSFKRKGLVANGTSDRGTAFLSPRADVAFAYASMDGGEARFLSGKSKHTDDKDRALLVFKIPRDWYEENKVREVGGSVPEVSFNTTIPAEFISDVIIGDRKKVYSYL